MDFSAFSHGQIQSKLWLCEQLEPYIPQNATVAILGSWYNILGFMLLTRNCNRYKSITGIDINDESIKVANNICEGWSIGENVKIRNLTTDVNTFNFNGYNLIINCSVEHMSVNHWLNNITKNTLVCIQSSNIKLEGEQWDIKNPCSSLDEFTAKYPLSHSYYKNQKYFDYGTWGYYRYMNIGIK